MKAGSILKCAFININGAQTELKNHSKNQEYAKILKENDVITLVETGTTEKPPDRVLNSINIM